MIKALKLNLEPWRHAHLGVALLVLFAGVRIFAADTLTLHLQNGDRLSGTLIAETTNTIVLSNAWNGALAVPIPAIARREVMEPALPSVVPVVQAEVPLAPTWQSNAAPTLALPIPARPPKRWHADVKLGADVIRGVKDRNIYYGAASLTYARPYASNPKQFFRSRLDYRADYSTTDDIESANRMAGSNKTDFDIGSRTFLYNFMGMGYDNVRKIDLQAEIGPGMGYRLVRTLPLALNVEGGLNYQKQDRTGAEDNEAFQFRVGEDVTWKMHQRVTLSQRATLLTAIDEPDELQFRFEGNLVFGLVQNLTFNLTVLGLYDTKPVPGISSSELQFRSALGVTF